MDLHFKGPCFTWSRGSLFKRLDRAICNDQWNVSFMEASVLHLPKLHSDHRPILVRFGRSLKKMNVVRPFRFLAAWLTDQSFQSLVAKEWCNSKGYTRAAHDFVDKVSVWNKENFGNIFKRKRNLLARLNGIQHALEKFDSNRLLELESKLKTELETILSQEELLWYQKSRREWISCGDRNTAFFSQKNNNETKEKPSGCNTEQRGYVDL